MSACPEIIGRGRAGISQSKKTNGKKLPNQGNPKEIPIERPSRYKAVTLKKAISGVLKSLIVSVQHPNKNFLRL
jgi:hypothetical protein